MTDYKAVNLTREARDALRQLSFTLTGAAGQKVTLSDAVIAAAGLAAVNPAAAVAFLPKTDGQQ
jgi:hypothetical protein